MKPKKKQIAGAPRAQSLETGDGSQGARTRARKEPLQSADQPEGERGAHGDERAAVPVGARTARVMTDRQIHRRCEQCGALAARECDLHLCCCEEQMNLCRQCRSLCRSDNRCGVWFFEAERFPLLGFTNGQSVLQRD